MNDNLNELNFQVFSFNSNCFWYFLFYFYDELKPVISLLQSVLIILKTKSTSSLLLTPDINPLFLLYSWKVFWYFENIL